MARTRPGRQERQEEKRKSDQPEKTGSGGVSVIWSTTVWKLSI